MLVSPHTMTKILVTGATGQIGSELTLALREKYGRENVIAAGHKTTPSDELKTSGPFIILDAIDKIALEKAVTKYKITQIYHLVSLLSAVGEKNPDAAWFVNMTSLKNVLDIARDKKLDKVFWPSSIAAFGPDTPREKTPQLTILNPNTMYGVTKVAGELLCNYYFQKYNLDIRSLRYPGIISWKTDPGGGTTDYTIGMYKASVNDNPMYDCFVNERTILPMMYMPDAIKATIDLMEAKPSNITVRTSYNLGAVSFSAKELEKEIQKHIPKFKCVYNPDFRQKIADSWPKTIDDSQARKDWNWKPEYNLSDMTKDILQNLQ